MKRIVCRRLGPPSVLAIEDMTPTPPGAGEVTVTVHAAGVNFPDLLMVAGGYQHKPPLPFCPGFEIAGRISAVGADVNDFKPGDSVMVRTGTTHDGFADAVTLPARKVIRMPKGMTYAEAAGFLVVYRTAIHSLEQKAALRPGETLAVLGAGGGVGIASVQVGRAMGARVIGVAAGAKLRHVTAEGASAVVDYGTESVRDRLKDLTGGRGVDVVLDTVGGAYFDAALRALATEGRYLVVGFAAGGGFPSVPANQVLIKEAAILGVRAGEFGRRYPEIEAENIRRLLALYRIGLIRPVVGRTYPLEEASAALEALARREVVGKIVLVTEAGRRDPGAAPG
ncbi:MAG: NADPH:quinone oxidoreductase family protein, partial [Alphaproteobacteria bacterium]